MLFIFCLEYNAKCLIRSIGALVQLKADDSAHCGKRDPDHERQFNATEARNIKALNRFFINRGLTIPKSFGVGQKTNLTVTNKLIVNAELLHYLLINLFK